jgi:hypothetical protein
MRVSRVALGASAAYLPQARPSPLRRYERAWDERAVDKRCPMVFRGEGGVSSCCAVATGRAGGRRAMPVDDVEGGGEGGWAVGVARGRERGPLKSESRSPAGEQKKCLWHKKGAQPSSGEGAGGNRGEDEEMGGARGWVGGRERGPLKSESRSPAGEQKKCLWHKKGAQPSSVEGAGGNRGENEEGRGGGGGSWCRCGRTLPGKPASPFVTPLWRRPPRRDARGGAADVSSSLGALSVRPHPGARRQARAGQGRRHGGACCHAAPRSPRVAR